MRFDPSLLDQIRDRIPISTVVGRRVTWDRRKTQARKGDYWACCPFHSEKSPSFHADDRRGRYHCFGCGASGDHFTFLVEREGLAFPEAVESLAAEAGVSLPKRDAREEAREEKRRSLYDVMEAAAAFYEGMLAGPEGAAARAVIRDRDLGSARARFRLGYAPNARAALKAHLAGKGVTPEEMVEAGLVVSGPDVPVTYDRFRDRLIFPIRDGRGRVIAFGGRAMAADVPAKYLNSPETPLFSKGRTLYNLDGARAARSSALLVVEGYIDAIRLVLAGYEATVAPLGTALTEEQLLLLWRMSDAPILCFDGDEAGQKAAYRALDLALPLLQPGKSLQFAFLPDGQDPDDLVREHGRDAFAAVIAATEPMAEVFWRREAAAQSLDTPEAQAGFEQRLYERIATIRDATVLRRYRAFARLRLAQLFDPFRDKRGKRTARPGLVASDARVKPGRLERVILGLCVEYPALLADFVEEICAAEFESPRHRAFADGLHSLYVASPEIDVSLIYAELGRDFFDVLDEIHGVGMEVVDISTGTPERRQHGRGRRLHVDNFPLFVGDRREAARFAPPDFAWQTMAYLLLLFELKRFEGAFAQLAGELSSEDEDGRGDSRRFAALFAQLQEKRDRVAQSEAELDAAYQALKNERASFAA